MECCGAISQSDQYNNVSIALHRPPKTAHLPLSHGGNTGSNPVGDANKINKLMDAAGNNLLTWIIHRARLGGVRTRARVTSFGGVGDAVRWV